MNLLKLAFIGLIVTTSSLSSQLQPPRSDNKHQKESTKFNSPTNPQPQQTNSYLWNLSFNKHGTIQDQSDSTNSQNNTNKESWHSPSMLIQVGLLIAGCIYTIFAALQWQAIRKQTDISDANLKITQRAYIGISFDPPGLSFDWQKKLVLLVLKITNFGETPATITDVVIHLVEHLPDIPREEKTKEIVFAKAFLVRNESFVYQESIWPFGDVFMIEHGGFTCFLYGHVDYIDIFEKRHRYGFIRSYDQPIGTHQSVHPDSRPNTNNLVFVSKPGFSYDRLRKPDEGKD